MGACLEAFLRIEPHMHGLVGAGGNYAVPAEVGVGFMFRKGGLEMSYRGRGKGEEGGWLPSGGRRRDILAHLDLPLGRAAGLRFLADLLTVFGSDVDGHAVRLAGKEMPWR